jgi:diguanylate cyclase (GGDEF)-like protein/PAS domain S-box-containing protein
MSATARFGRVPLGGGPAGFRRVQVREEPDAALRSLVDFLDAFMWQADPETLDLTFVSKSARDLLGYPASRWLGGPEQWSEFIHPNDRAQVIECLRATAADGQDREVEFRVRAADRRTRILRHAVRLLADASGKAELWGLTTDLTADRHAEEALQATRERYRELSVEAAEFRRQALEDPLTGLPNRILLDDRLGTTLRAAQRSGEPCAVLLIDLDGFKEINDTKGHHAGDEVLRQVALRLKIALRAQDTPARIGGDEFAAVLPNTDAAGATRTAERIVRALEEIRASIGIAVFPDHGKKSEELLEHADQAMYHAKDSGGGYALFASDAAVTKRWARRRVRGRFLTPGRRAMIGLVVTFALMSGSMTQTGRMFVRDDSATRLAAAVIALESASVDTASAYRVATVVGDAEIALAEISWADVGQAEVVIALDALQRSLVKLKKSAPSSVAGRVNHLIATVTQAQVAGSVTDAVPDVAVPTPAPKVPDAAKDGAPVVPDSGPTP